MGFVSVGIYWASTSLRTSWVLHVLGLLGLYFGQENFESGIVTAVRAGWDTDCNGATVGSILGVRCGSKKLPGKWVDKFNDRLMSAVKGHNENRFSSLAKRTVQVAKKVLNSPAEQEAVSTKETSPGGCWDLETGWGRQRVNFDAGTIKFLEDGFNLIRLRRVSIKGKRLILALQSIKAAGISKLTSRE